MKSSAIVLAVMALVLTCTAAPMEKKQFKKAPEVTVTGYLIDVKSAMALMQTNDVAIPAKQHERTADLLPANAASGYGVFVVVNKTSTHASDVDFFKLDAAGNKMAKALLEKSKKKDNILVTINGKAMLAPQEMIEVK